MSKFDRLNPIKGSLLAEIEYGKLTDEAVKKFLDGAPSTKDLEIKRLFENLENFNRNNALTNVTNNQKLKPNSYNDDDDSNDKDGGLPSFDLDLLLYVPKNLAKIDLEPKLESKSKLFAKPSRPEAVVGTDIF